MTAKTKKANKKKGAKPELGSQVAAGETARQEDYPNLLAGGQLGNAGGGRPRTPQLIKEAMTTFAADKLIPLLEAWIVDGSMKDLEGKARPLAPSIRLKMMDLYFRTCSLSNTALVSDMDTHKVQVFVFGHPSHLDYVKPREIEPPTNEIVVE